MLHSHLHKWVVFLLLQVKAESSLQIMAPD
jgi:hypothetical protein